MNLGFTCVKKKKKLNKKNKKVLFNIVYFIVLCFKLSQDLVSFCFCRKTAEKSTSGVCLYWRKSEKSLFSQDMMQSWLKVQIYSCNNCLISPRLVKLILRWKRQWLHGKVSHMHRNALECVSWKSQWWGNCPIIRCDYPRSYDTPYTDHSPLSHHLLQGLFLMLWLRV